MRYLAPLLLLIFTPHVYAAPPADLTGIERRLTGEPTYNCDEPRYCLVVMGRAMQRVWLVLDQSDPASGIYDVLYADLNGDGDLTDPAERFSPETTGPQGVQRDSSLRFRLPDFTDAEGATHTNFTVSVNGGAKPYDMVSVLWRGEQKFGGGYPADPDDGYMQFAPSPETAPVLWINGDGPFRFQRWYSATLHVNYSDDFKVFLGQQGIGPSSFAAFQEHVLPEGEPIRATLIYHDTDGEQREAESLLDRRC